jgi:hypothetical protein
VFWKFAWNIREMIVFTVKDTNDPLVSKSLLLHQLELEKAACLPG